jgi:hypothetical protein
MSEVSPPIPTAPAPNHRAHPTAAGKRTFRIPRLRLRARLESPEGSVRRSLRRLDFARGPIELEPIAGGITNRNFAVRTGGRRYVARWCRDLPLLGIDRRNEVACQRAAGTWGLAPELVHHEPGLLLTRFVEGRTLAAADVREPSCLARAAALLQRLHGSWDTMTGEILYFCPFQTVRT